MEYTFDTFIEQHKSQLISSDVPEYFWNTLYDKLEKELFDIGEFVELKLNNDESNLECRTHRSLFASDNENIFLIDHAFSFKLDDVRSVLNSNDSLRDRVASMVGLDTENAESEDVIEAIMENIWPRLRFYELSSKLAEEKIRIWYLVDEVGNFLKHDSTNPNMKIAPFIHAKTGLGLSIAWLIRNVDSDEALSIDMTSHIVDPYLNKCYSYIWTKELPDKHLRGVYKSILSPEFFTSHKIEETEPDRSISCLGKLNLTKTPLKVFSNLTFVQNNLTDKDFILTDKQEEADILWLYDHFKDFKNLSIERPRTMINQFPNENVVTIKDLLAALGSENNWIPKTFNMKVELAQFINYFNDLKTADVSEEDLPNNCACNCHYLNIECGVCLPDRTCRSIKSNIDPVWIVKPWNLARGMGIFISQNLDHILRMAEAFPGEPKIASRYISDPVLFYRQELSANVKFDIRYMILLKSVEPLEVYVTKVFWLRFANKEFVLANWEDYETHFTVMNYRGNADLKNILCDEFVEMFDQQNPHHKWSNVESKIFDCLREMMHDVTQRSDPFRIKPSPQSRAIYAVDLMLEWDYQSSTEPQINPQICEVNYCPDCTRACLYHPDYFNDVFRTLFLDQPTNVHRLV